MNSESSRFREKQEESHQKEARAEIEFSSIEEMIQKDRSGVTPPEQLAAKINASLGALPRARTPWWKRIFSRD